MGADDYVTKAFSLRELLARIRAQLRRAYGDLAAPNASCSRPAGWPSTWPADRCAAGKRPLSLTPTEFRLLVYLAPERRTGALPSADPGCSVGYDADVESERIVNVQIRRLREKVEVDPPARL